MKKRTIITILALAAALLPISVINADEPKEIVYNMFNEVLKRNPTPYEFDKYMDLVIENGWDNSDLKRVLRKKKSDAEQREIYGDSHDDNYRNSHDDHYHGNDYDRNYDKRDRHYSNRDYYERRRWVENSFEDHLGRLPNKREMEEYCDECLHEKYTRKELSRRISDDYRGKPRNRGNNRNDRYNYDRYSSSEEVEIIIEDIFEEELGREVDEASMRKYRRLMIDDGWSERQVRNDVAANPEVLREDLEKVVVRAYEDLLEQSPLPRDRDYYVDQMLQRHWDERELRKHIKRSKEYTYDRPRNLIEKAYKSVLLRDPDSSAYSLTGTIKSKDWDLQDVEKHLRKGNEYRTQTIPKMLETAYMELLNRKPDTYGIGYYTERLLEGWSFKEMKDHIRASDEYAKKQNK